MNDLDLAKFRKAIDLAQLGRTDEAHGLLNELKQAHPADTNVLLWEAYTSTDLIEAKNTLREAASHDPKNSEIHRANLWLEERQKQRLGKRFRGDITQSFVPHIPAELINGQFLQPTKIMPASIPPTSNSSTQGQVTTVTTPVKPQAKVINPEKEDIIPVPNRKQKVVKAKPAKTKRVRTGPSFVQTAATNFRKLVLGMIIAAVVLVVIGGGLLLLQPVREFVFNTGPLTQTEQSFITDATSINDLSSSRINVIYPCIVNPNTKTCPLENGYTQAYVNLGDVVAKYDALKSPSSRFDGPYNTLLRAYNSLSNTSKFAFDSMNLHQMVANQAETARRLDEGRNLLEQGKAELKSVAQQYSPKK